MKVLKFKKGFDVYAPGDIASLEDKLAEEAVKQGAADEYSEDKKSAEAANVKKPLGEDEKQVPDQKAVHTAPVDKAVNNPNKAK